VAPSTLAMKLETLQIRWHGQEPVFAADFHASGRLATGGADKSVKIWMVTERPASLLDSGTSDGATAAAVAPSSSISSSALATSGASSKEREREQRQRVGMRAGIEIEFLAELSRHTQSVNCVRFSPDGTGAESSHRFSGTLMICLVVVWLYRRGVSCIECR